MNQTPTSQHRLLTAEELAAELNLPSAKAVRLLTQKGVLKCIRLGYRTRRYSLESAFKALQKLEVSTANAA